MEKSVNCFDRKSKIADLKAQLFDTMTQKRDTSGPFSKSGKIDMIFSFSLQLS